MTRTDLDKILLKKIVYGISCPSCGGELERCGTPPRRWWSRIRSRFFGHPVFRCTICRRSFDLRVQRPAD